MADTTTNYGFHYPLQKDNPLEARRYLDEIDSTLYGVTGGVGPVVSFNGRTGVVVSATNDYTWAQINKTTSSLADLATRSASDLSSGTLAVARGGTGAGSFTAKGVLYGNGTSAFGVTAAPSSDYMVLSVYAGAPVFTDQPNVQSIRLGVGSSTTGDLSLANSTNNNPLHIQSGINAGAWTMTMPTSAGTGDYVLRTDGGGVTSWISGQSIAGLKTTSSPEFSDLTLSGSNPANGFLKVGTYNIIPGAIGINVAGVTTAHNQAYGAYIEGSDLSYSGVGPNTTVTTAVTGIYSLTRTHLNSAPITILYAIEGDAIIHNATSLDRGYGVYALVDVTTSTITQRVVGVRSNVTLANANTIPLAIGFKGTQTISTGTVTDVRGLDLSEWSASSTVTTSYGIYIDSSVDIGTTKYSIYSISLSNSLLQGGLSLGVAGTTLGLLKLNGNTSGTITINGAAAAGTWTLTLPTGAGTSGYVLSTNGSGVTSWVAQSGGGSGASTALDNLASVAINASLLPGTDNAIDLGSTSKYWRDVFVKGNLKSRDTSAAFDALLAFTSSTALTANRIFTIDLVNAARTLKLTGNPTIADWFDQSVKTTASPTFAGITGTGVLTMGSGPTTLTNADGTLKPASISGYPSDATKYLKGDGSWGTVASSQWTTTGSDIYYNTGKVGIGVSPSYQVDVQKDQNATTVFQIQNATSGTAARTDFWLTTNGGAQFTIQAISAGYTTSGLVIAASARFRSSGGLTGGMVIATGSTGPMIYAINDSEQMRLNGTGLGIGVSPSYLLDVNGTIHYTTLTASSDERFKKKMVKLDGAALLQKAKNISAYSFEWNEFINDIRDGYELNKPTFGFNAQEFEKEFPELVSKWELRKGGRAKKGKPDQPEVSVLTDARSMSYERCVPLMWAMILEQQKQIEELRSR